MNKQYVPEILLNQMKEKYGDLWRTMDEGIIDNDLIEEGILEKHNLTFDDYLLDVDKNSFLQVWEDDKLIFRYDDKVKDVSKLGYSGNDLILHNTHSMLLNKCIYVEHEIDLGIGEELSVGFFIKSNINRIEDKEEEYEFKTQLLFIFTSNKTFLVDIDVNIESFGYKLDLEITEVLKQKIEKGIIEALQVSQDICLRYFDKCVDKENGIIHENVFISENVEIGFIRDLKIITVDLETNIDLYK